MSTESQVPPSSYSQQITHNVLRGLNVKLPNTAIVKIISQTNHIYHLMCRLTSTHLYNTLVLEHCRELDEYAKQEIAHQIEEQLLITHARETQEDEAQQHPASQLEIFFQQAHGRLEQLNAMLMQANEHSQQQYGKIQKICADQLAQWSQLQQEHATQLKQTLQQTSRTLPACFTKKLPTLLIHQGVTATNPSTLITALTHLDTDNFVHHCLVAALTCEATSDTSIDPQWLDGALQAVAPQAQQAWQQSMAMLEQFSDRITQYTQVIQNDYQEILIADTALLKLANEVREARRKRTEHLRHKGANVQEIHDEIDDLIPFSRSSY